MNFDEQKLAGRLSGRFIGREVYFLREVDSTNIYALNLARKGAPEGVVVIADCQTNGKGRLGRKWQSPPGKNIYTSIILRPSIDPSVAPQITLIAGVAVARLLSLYCPGDVALKWPNDVQIRGKKICGILTEMRMRSGRVDFVIVGIGINIGMKKEEFSEELKDCATSLIEETGKNISRFDFAVGLYDSFETWYKNFLSGGFNPIREEWLKYSCIIGKNMRISLMTGLEEGKAIGIDDQGALLIFDEEKGTKRIIAGDVSLMED